MPPSKTVMIGSASVPFWMLRNGVSVSPAEGLDAARAREVMVGTLGPAWGGFSAMSADRRLLGGLLALHMGADARATALLSSPVPIPDADREEAVARIDGAMGKAAEGAPPGDATSDEGLLIECILAEAGSRHGYEATVLLDIARAAFAETPVPRLGALRFLARDDAPLWHAINALPSLTAVRPAGAAIVSHWIAERAEGRAMHVPQMDSALHALTGLIRRLDMREISGA